MCAGPVKNLYEDVTGITAQKNAAKEAAKNAAMAAENQAIIDANKQSTLAIGAQAETDNQAAAAAAANTIQNIQQQAQTQIVVGGGGNKGPSQAEINARNAQISAAQTSQSIINKQGKKKKKSLKISPKDAYAQGTGSPGSTSASLKIGSQGSSPGTGTNLPV
tara:strand:+ start:525 stop:1013 length:489 start_codon:yes stop_codon:yes gene_type:complete